MSDKLLAELADAKYAALSDEEAADNLNAKTVARIRLQMSGDEVFRCTVLGELKTDDRLAWVSFCARQGLNPDGANRDFVALIFGDPSATLTAFDVARTEQISRAEELEIPPVFPGHVQEMRRLRARGFTGDPQADAVVAEAELSARIARRPNG